MVRCFFMAVLLGVTITATQGCFIGQSCRTERIIYTGTKSGTLIHKASGPSGSSGGIQQMQGPFDTGASGGLSGHASCSSPLEEDEAGWKALAWLDVDGDEVEACSKDLSSPDCAPDAHDPRGETTFTQGATGLTTYRVELHERE